MKNRFWILSALMILSAGLAAEGAPFTPGNIVLVDAAGGRDHLIEVNLGGPGAVIAEVAQIVTWELGDTSRRRPLGVAFDPNGTCYVGLTGVPTSATEAVEFPEGRGEILRILPDGTQHFYILPIEVTKGTWVSSYAPNEVFVMSNEPPPSPSLQFRIRFQGNEIADITTFEVTESLQANGSGGSGKAMVLPDGRILIPSETDNRIGVFDDSGGAPVELIPTEHAYRSLAYIDGTDYLLAMRTNGTTVDSISFEGAVQGTFDFSLDGLGGVWNFSVLNDGTERFIVTNHNGPAGSKNQIFIYDASDLESIFPDILDIAKDPPANQLFDHAVAPVPTGVSDWTLF